MIKNVLNKLGSVRIALVASVGFPFIIATNGFAQAPPPPPAPGAAAPAAEVERVIVTGSLIPTAEEVGPNPIFALNRDLINKSGAGTTTEQLLQRQPIMNGSNIPVNNNGTGQSGATGNGSDDAEYRGDLLFGVGNDTTSITGDIFYYKHHDMFNHDRQNSLNPPFLSSNAVPWNLQLQTQAILHPFDINGNPQPPPVLTPAQLARTTNFGTAPDNSNGLTPASDYIYDLG